MAQKILVNFHFTNIIDAYRIQRKQSHEHDTIIRQQQEQFD